MFKKAFVGISIFVLLFVGAWLLNEQTKREYYLDHDDESEYQVQQTDDGYMINESGRYRIFPAFMSREYIRVDR
ncbi:hypothetical protein [Bacillus sp. PS06]|uniref:hypothetical protein n=1 Tax=Bacillus sp. PS06 TaxID=2764176 RepID=UPI00178315E0|nr:hypothetical protein [Bacillus sp. PS06]MBD8070493.1 hypothetical protein [Bacillus sp. PS06]